MCHKYFVPALCVVLLAVPEMARGEEVLTWEDCAREAQKNNPEVKAYYEVVKQSEAEEKIALSELMPQIDFSVSGDSFHGRSKNTSDFYSHSFTGEQLIFDGFQTIYRYKEAQEFTKAARFLYLFASSQVRLQLRSAFVELLREQERFKIAHEVLERRQKSFDFIRRRFEAKSEAEGAWLFAQANLSEAQAEVGSSQRDIDLARRRLLKEMGRAEFFPVEAAGAFEVMDVQTEPPDFAGLAEGTPLLKQFISFTKEAKYGVKEAIGEFFPEFSLDAEFGRSDGSWPPRHWEESWTVGVRGSIAIFDGGERAGFLKRARADLRQAKHFERDQRGVITVNLNEKWTALQDALENVPVQERFLKALEARANATGTDYEKGEIEFEDWIYNEDDLVDQKNTYLDARRDALLAEAEWQQAKGITLDEEK